LPFLIHSKLTKLRAEFQNFCRGDIPELPHSGDSLPVPSNAAGCSVLAIRNMVTICMKRNATQSQLFCIKPVE